MPMLYIDDCIEATIKFLKADKDRLTRNVYNLAGISFTPKELSEAVMKIIPGTKVEYEPDYRQAIADSWPKSLEDSDCKRDWDWTYDITTLELAQKILDKIEPEYKKSLESSGSTGKVSPALR